MIRNLRMAILAAVTGAFCAIGAGAQDFSFLKPDGSTASLSGFRGKVVVLLFSGVQDPQCREELKTLESLAERYQGKDVVISWVSINTANELSNQKLASPCGTVNRVVTLRDANQAAFKRFAGKNAQLPTVVVLDRNGQLFGHPRGGFNPNSDFINDLGAMIDRLLK